LHALSLLRATGHGTPGALGLASADRARARAFLRPREASWNDGDDNLIRERLGSWKKGAETSQARAAVLLDTARFLAQMKPRPETLWCFLWHFESHLLTVLEDD
jgi:hypothetical protein